MKELCKPESTPAFFVSDFEVAVVSTIKEVFPVAEHTGCHFHFAQAIYRAIQKCGLQSLYIKNPDIASELNKLISLAFVPVADIETVYEEIISDLNITIHKFFIYYNNIFLYLIEMPPRSKTHYGATVALETSTTMASKYRHPMSNSGVIDEGLAVCVQCKAVVKAISGAMRYHLRVHNGGTGTKRKSSGFESGLSKKRRPSIDRGLDSNSNDSTLKDPPFVTLH